MAKATKKASNVVPMKPIGKVSNNPDLFHIEGSVTPSGKLPNGKTLDVDKFETSFSANLDFSGVSREDLFRMAAQTIVIKLAGNARAKHAATWNKQQGKRTGDFAAIVRETFPAVINVQEAIVPKLRSTSSAKAVDTMVSRVEKMSPEKQKEMLEKLLALQAKSTKK